MPWAWSSSASASKDLASCVELPLFGGAPLLGEGLPVVPLRDVLLVLSRLLLGPAELKMILAALACLALSALLE